MTGVFNCSFPGATSEIWTVVEDLMRSKIVSCIIGLLDLFEEIIYLFHNFKMAMIQNATVKSDQPLLWHGCRVGATCNQLTVARSLSRPRAPADLLQQQKTTRPAPAANKGNLQLQFTQVWCNDAEYRFRAHISFLRANIASPLWPLCVVTAQPLRCRFFHVLMETSHKWLRLITIPDGIVIIAIVVQSAVIYKVLRMDMSNYS